MFVVDIIFYFVEKANEIKTNSWSIIVYGRLVNNGLMLVKNKPTLSLFIIILFNQPDKISIR